MRRFISSVMAQSRPRRFAPLRAGATAGNDLPKLQGVVFDVDGTLCKPQNHMFGQMRQVLNIPKSTDILEHVYSLPPGPGQGGQDEAMESIRSIERAMMVEQEAQPGLVELMAYLDSRAVRKGICTRNFNAPVEHLLQKFLRASVIGPVVTRDFRPPKPDPAGILFIAKTWGLVRGATSEKNEKTQGAGEVRISSSSSSSHSLQNDEGGEGPAEKAEQACASEPGDQGNSNNNNNNDLVHGAGDASQLIMVGDSIDDMTAGYRAGAATVLLVNDANRHLAEHEHTDLVISRLDELIEILEDGFQGRAVP